MSIPERIYKISKAYLNQVRDRIDSELAERELQASLEESNSGLPPRDDASPEAMIQRAEQRIAALRREAEARANGGINGAAGAAPSPAASDPLAASTSPVLDAAARTGTGANPSNAQATTDPNASDFKVLGVPAGSDFATVQAAYEKLARRCDPRRFPEGSTEQKEAERILTRVNASFEALRKRLDPTVNRFGKLELE